MGDPAASLRVLVVDDEDAVRDSLAGFLRDCGHEVRDAADGVKALEALDGFEADAVVSDIRMPVLDGIGLLKEIKRTRPGVEVIIVTGFQDMETAIEATRNNAFDYITKPYDLRQIHGLLEKIRARREMDRDLKRKDEEIARSRRLASLGALAAGVMHEINNPNTVVLGNVEMLRRRLGAALATEKTREALRASGADADWMLRALDAIEAGAWRVSEIVAATTRFAARRVETARADVKETLERLACDLRSAPPPGARLRIEVPPGPAEVEASEEEIRQIVSNLVSNAVEATDAEAVRVGDGEIVAAIRVEGGTTVIEVSDGGAGVPDRVAERLFEPFATSKRDRPGRGVGLFVVAQIAEQRGGGARYERREGRSVFTVSLPSASASPEEA